MRKTFLIVVACHAGRLVDIEKKRKVKELSPLLLVGAVTRIKVLRRMERLILEFKEGSQGP